MLDRESLEGVIDHLDKQMLTAEKQKGAPKLAAEEIVQFVDSVKTHPLEDRNSLPR